MLRMCQIAELTHLRSACVTGNEEWSHGLADDIVSGVGDESVRGAGSGVTRDLPPNVPCAAGDPPHRTSENAAHRDSYSLG